MIIIRRIFTLTLIGISIIGCNNSDSAKVIRSNSNNEITPHYKGTESCTSCHQSEAAKWSESHHALAMQEANSNTILANFNNQIFTGGGIKSRFFTNNGEYFVETEGPKGNPETYKIIHTFGVKPLQQYLVDIGNGKIQALRTAWDTENGKWYDLYPDQEIIPQDWLHWTRGGLNWNTMCAECHTTNLEKNYDQVADSYNTTFEAINVACESCHGAGEQHLEWAKNPGADSLSYIKLTKNITSTEQVRSCAPCHARKGNISEKLTFEGDILEDYIPEVLIDGLYHADGQILDEVYVYGSFTQSKMYHNGVKCSDCHDPHSLELKATGNQLCMQCHEPKYDDPSHTFHKEGSTGSLCIECHMTGETYMGVDFRRDHSFRVPRPDQSVAYGTPNACTTCHDDKTDQWAAENIVELYGPDRSFHFSDILAPGRSRHPDMISPLANLAADFKQPDIARATAAYYLSGIPSNESYGGLISLLGDSSSLVRYYSVSGLSSLSPEQRSQFVSPLLNDTIRGVRIEAAEVLSDLTTEQIPLPYQAAFNKAMYEYEKSLINRGDFPMGQFMLGQFYYQRGDINKSILHYTRSLKMDTLLHMSRENLARIYNQQGNNQLALELLKTTLNFDPENAQSLYSIGLIHAELNQLDSTTFYLSRAVKIDPGNERAVYNLGLAYQHQELEDKAENAYKEGVKVITESVILRQALAILYLQQGRKSDAEPIVQYLIERFPQEQQIIELQQALNNL